MKSLSMPKVYNTYFLAAISTIGGMLFGFDISSIAAIIVTPQYIHYFGNPSGIWQGAIGAALSGGSIVGAACAGLISDRIGRRDAIAFGCLWWLAGTAVQVSTHSRGQLIVGRVLNGVCVGITSSQVPVYLAEIAKKNRRGSILVIQQLAIEVGIFVMYFVGYGCSFIAGPASFRTAWGIQYVPCVLLLAGLPFLPRSPRWLAKVGRTTEAVQILAAINAKGDQSDPMVVAEWEEITMTLAAEREALPGWRRFVKNGMWKRTLAGFSVQAWQQLSGSNVMTYYLTYVFIMAGLKGNTDLIASGIEYALYIVFTMITFTFIDRTGRRVILISGAIGMGICLFVVGGVMGTYGTPHPNGVQGNANITISVHGSPSYAIIAFCYLLVIIYALTLAPVCWVYAAEVWSLETRGMGMGISATGNWIFNFALNLFVPPAFKNISWKTFMIFGALCMAAAIQFYFTYPETCQKSLEEIEEMFRPGGPKPWKTTIGHSHLDEMTHEIAAEQSRKASLVGETNEKVAIADDGTFQKVEENEKVDV